MKKYTYYHDRDMQWIYRYCSWFKLGEMFSFRNPRWRASYLSRLGQLFNRHTVKITPEEAEAMFPGSTTNSTK